MKIAIINTTYNVGSTGKLVYNFREYLLSKKHDVIVLFRLGEQNSVDKLFNICTVLEMKLHNLFGRLTGFNGCFSLLATRRAKILLSNFRPDIVYLGNLHGHYINIYLLYKYLRKQHIPIVKIMWDEYAMTGACAFSYECVAFKEKCNNCSQRKSYPISFFFDTSAILQKMKSKAYKSQKICFVSVPYIAEKAKKSFLLKDKTIYALDEAVDQDHLYYPRETDVLRHELCIDDNMKIILNVCLYPDKRKGGQYFLELARKLLNAKDLVFVHVGFMGDRSECPSNYIPIGYECDQNKMAMYYSMADLLICTSLAETQPNTCIEALSCGTPICGFDISGIPTCAESPYGCFVEPRNVNALVDVVLQSKKKTKNNIEAIRNYAQSRFSSHDYNRNLLEIGWNLLRNSSSNVKDINNSKYNI